jgi:DNA-binding GntR family transcriptional regulator
LDPIFNIQFAISNKERQAVFVGARSIARERALDRIRGSKNLEGEVKVKTTDIAMMASASDVIADALRDAITSGDLTEGQVLRQEDIARMFNVSRIPVRQAFVSLEAQGLLVTQRYRGAVVASLSAQEILEIYEFRALLESEVVRLAVKSIDDGRLALAQTYCDRFDAAQDPSQWGELNRLFHYTLYESCRRPYYLQVINSALGRIERYQRAQLSLTDGRARASAEHLAILNACKRRDAEGAGHLMREHITGAGLALVNFLRRQRDEKETARPGRGWSAEPSTGGHSSQRLEPGEAAIFSSESSRQTGPPDLGPGKRRPHHRGSCEGRHDGS